MASDGGIHSKNLALASNNPVTKSVIKPRKVLGNPVLTQPARPVSGSSSSLSSPATAPILTVLDGDLALPVIHPQHRLILSPPLGHDADFPLAVITVVGGILAQG